MATPSKITKSLLMHLINMDFCILIILMPIKQIPHLTTLAILSSTPLKLKNGSSANSWTINYLFDGRAKPTISPHVANSCILTRNGCVAMTNNNGLMRITTSLQIHSSPNFDNSIFWMLTDASLSSLSYTWIRNEFVMSSISETTSKS